MRPAAIVIKNLLCDAREIDRAKVGWRP